MTNINDEEYKSPLWQKSIKSLTDAVSSSVTSLLLRPWETALGNLKMEGYLQKRAGRSRIRWNIRYFKLQNGGIWWMRPTFMEQIRLKKPGKESRAVRSLRLDTLTKVYRVKAKFPYSTRVILKFPEYTLELRAEKEAVMMDWFNVLSQFVIDRHEQLDTDYELSDTNDALDYMSEDED